MDPSVGRVSDGGDDGAVLTVSESYIENKRSDSSRCLQHNRELFVTLHFFVVQTLAVGSHSEYIFNPAVKILKLSREKKLFTMKPAGSGA